jgi:hypothetical protein
MNPGGPKSGSDTPHSVSDVVNMETDELLVVAEDAGFGLRKQEALKSLVTLKPYHLFQVLIYCGLGVQARWLLMCTDRGEVQHRP